MDTTFTCKQCATPFALTKNEVLKREAKGGVPTFCTSECRQRHSKENGSKIVSCFHCGVDFKKLKSQIEKSTSGNHYCSRSCSAKSTNAAAPKRKMQRMCSKCGKDFAKDGKTKLCKSCFDSRIPLSDLTLRDYQSRKSVAGKHSSWLNSAVRLHNRSSNKALTLLPCQMCGYSTHVELCHIEPVHSFADDSTLSTINAPSNILVLCRNHHWEFDNKILLIDDIPSREV